MDEKKVVKQKPQTVLLENREKMCVTGVIDVESFNEECVIIHTEVGGLAIHGEGLHISKLNLDIGELNIEGYICSMEYSDVQSSRGGFFSRLFR